MERYADPANRKIACQCSAQSTKTVLMYACAGYSFLEDPGPMMWVTKSKPEAVTMAAELATRHWCEVILDGFIPSKAEAGILNPTGAVQV